MGRPTIAIDQRSLELTILGIGNARVTLRQASQAAVFAAGDFFLRAARANVSYRDHSARDLARLDHPYARRHGSLTLHAGVGALLADGRHAVHAQTGRLAGALRGGLVQTSGTFHYEVSVDTVAAPHWAHVVHGTKTMLPRDPLGQTELSPAVQKEMRRRVVSVLGRALRAQASIRFGALP